MSEVPLQRAHEAPKGGRESDLESDLGRGKVTFGVPSSLGSGQGLLVLEIRDTHRPRVLR